MVLIGVEFCLVGIHCGRECEGSEVGHGPHVCYLLPMPLGNKMFFCFVLFLFLFLFFE